MTSRCSSSTRWQGRPSPSTLFWTSYTRITSWCSTSTMMPNPYSPKTYNFPMAIFWTLATRGCVSGLMSRSWKSVGFHWPLIQRLVKWSWRAVSWTVWLGKVGVSWGLVSALCIVRSFAMSLWSGMWWSLNQCLWKKLRFKSDECFSVRITFLSVLIISFCFFLIKLSLKRKVFFFT